MIVPGTQENINNAIKLLAGGDVISFPTETVYGLGALYNNEQGLRKIFELKKRNSTNPLIVHGDSIEKLNQIVDTQSLTSIQKKLLHALSSFWPGPLSVVLPCKKSISKILTAGNDSVAFRIPSHPVAQTLIKDSKSLIAAPSANVSKNISPTTAQHVKDEFGEDVFILDGGASKNGIESTVVSLLNDEAKILRPGSITTEMLSDVLSCSLESLFSTNELNFHSPGHEKKHYAPKTPLFFIGSTPATYSNKVTVFLTPPLHPPVHRYVVLSPQHNELVVASELYATLRDLDKQGYDAIEIEKPLSTGIGVALLDRLTRAHYPV